MTAPDEEAITLCYVGIDEHTHRGAPVARFSWTGMRTGDLYLTVGALEARIDALEAVERDVSQERIGLVALYEYLGDAPLDH